MLIANWKSNGSRAMAIDWFNNFFEKYSLNFIRSFFNELIFLF